MGTRATIKVEGISFAKVYKHFDGDVSSTLPWLENFNKTFTKERGNDSEYKFAQLLRSSVRDQEKYRLDPSTDTGWGVGEYDMNYGEEYEYVLKGDGSVTWKKV